MSSSSTQLQASAGFALFASDPKANFNSLNALRSDSSAGLSPSSAAKASTKSSRRKSAIMAGAMTQALFGGAKGYEPLSG
ncbi:hypothetical protein FRC03_010391 [Tulasnella sp. 419]|nr:hypothetical protein FRC02_001947 [Tulasnella sp. 418]KAG8970201.1 hypothetical protein FRC03_010391 [Tulasnella sp. 419]